MNGNLELARQWVAKAQNDLLNADNKLKTALPDIFGASVLADELCEEISPIERPSI